MLFLSFIVEIFARIVFQASYAADLSGKENDRATSLCASKIQLISIFGRDIPASSVRPTLPHQNARIRGADRLIGWLPGPSKFIRKNDTLTKKLYETSINKYPSLQMWLIDEFSRASQKTNKHASVILRQVAEKYPTKKFLVAINYADPHVISVLRDNPNVFVAPLLMTIKSTYHASKKASLSKRGARMRLMKLRQLVPDKQIVPITGMFFPQEQIFQKDRLATFESDMRYILDEWTDNGTYLAIYNNQNDSMLASLQNVICRPRKK